jgi:hypothetical protein
MTGIKCHRLTPAKPASLNLIVGGLMTATTRTVITLPEFDTGRYEGCDFLMSGGDARLTIRVSGIAPISIQFGRARWHQFTALYNCSAEQMQGCYFVLAELIDSPAVIAYSTNDKAGVKGYRELHHYRIFLDETGCHELFAESCAAL